MKNKILLTAILSSFIAHGVAFGQGSLTPPGAPAPTMRTLAQIEPRTPISSAPFSITQPGSYYLTTNLAGTVTIGADNVTLDLMGFAIVTSTGNALSESGARSRVVVRNGTLSATNANGIDLSISTSTANSLLEDLRIYGCQNYGIAVGGGYIVRQCQIDGCRLAGILAIGNSDIRDCTVTGCNTGLRSSAPGARFSANIVHGNTNNYEFVDGSQLDLLLSEVPQTISWSAHVTLAGNLTVSTGNAITIAVNNVSLDLNGFTIGSTRPIATTDSAILLNGVTNVSIANGNINSGVTNNGSGVYSGSGFGYGINSSGSIPANVLVSRVSVAGCLSDGIYLNTGNSTVVENCTVQTVGSYGIFASTIKQSTARDCGSYAIYADQVADCRGECSGSGAGVVATTAQNCFGQSYSSGYGVYATSAQNCYGYSSSGTGLSTYTAQNCLGSSGSSGNGVYASATALNCYGYSYGNGYGLYASYTAQNCYGYSYSGTGLSALIASICHGGTYSGTALSTTHNVNSF